jgi:hypothetical protein
MRSLPHMTALLLAAVLVAAPSAAEEPPVTELRGELRSALLEQLQAPRLPARLPLMGVDPLQPVRIAPTREARPLPAERLETGRQRLREVVERVSARDAGREEQRSGNGPGRGRRRADRADRAEERHDDRPPPPEGLPPPHEHRREGDAPPRR